MNVAVSSTRTVVPSGRGNSGGVGMSGRESLTRRVSHGSCQRTSRARQNGRGGGRVTPESLTIEVTTELGGDVEELLVEEVSIDGLCGVY
jgi:mycofactocin precursor